MEYVGIIGDPLGHSLSPAFQQAAFDHLDLNIEYQSWPTKKRDLPERINLLRSEDIIGANITIPYKIDVMEMVDEIDEKARIIGSINTIHNKNGKLFGYNTDSNGFIRSLYEESDFKPDGIHALVIGAGGSARAVISGLIEKQIDRIIIANKTIEKAVILMESFDKPTKPIISTVKFQDLPSVSPERKFDLIVNCTPLGMKGTNTEDQFPDVLHLVGESTIVYDLVYNPQETQLLKRIKLLGGIPVSGLGMLVHQGALAFKIWTGHDAPTETMVEAIKNRLKLNT